MVSLRAVPFKNAGEKFSSCRGRLKNNVVLETVDLDQPRLCVELEADIAVVGSWWDSL